MNRADLVNFVRRHPLAVEASTAASGGPQAAVVGIVVNDSLEIFFDTLATTRKCQNLRRDPRISLVVGWSLAEERTAQIDGIADEPKGEELARWKQRYFAAFPDGVTRETWDGITYFRVRPRWVRYSDFLAVPPLIVELDAAALAGG